MAGLRSRLTSSSPYRPARTPRPLPPWSSGARLFAARVPGAGGVVAAGGRAAPAGRAVPGGGGGRVQQRCARRGPGGWGWGRGWAGPAVRGLRLGACSWGPAAGGTRPAARGCSLAMRLLARKKVLQGRAPPAPTTACCTHSRPLRPLRPLQASLRSSTRCWGSATWRRASCPPPTRSTCSSGRTQTAAASARSRWAGWQAGTGMHRRPPRIRGHLCNTCIHPSTVLPRLEPGRRPDMHRHAQERPGCAAAAAASGSGQSCSGGASIRRQQRHRA